jgi:signal transduction histidine kinase
MPMLHSLRFRLLLTLIGVVVVVVGTVALFASRVTSRELQRYVELDIARNQRLTSNVMTYYARNRDSGDPQALMRQIAGEVDERVIVTDGAGTVLADSSEQFVGQTLGCEIAFPAVVVTIGSPRCETRLELAAGGVGGLRVGSRETSDIVFLGMPFESSRPAGTKPLTTTFQFEAAAPLLEAVGGGPALLIRRTQGLELDPIETGFVDAVNRSLLWAVAAAGVAAVLLTLLLSRRILGPVEALTAAARAMEKGDLSRRVEVASRDEIGALAHAFNAMADGLARQERLRRNMVTDVAHELRTPLTNIRGYLEALRDGVARPTHSMLASLHEEALLLNRLVDDLQDLALAEAGQLHLAPRPVELAALVAQAVEAIQPAASEKDLRVEMALAADLPRVQADPERVAQVLRNLLNNAIRHTPGGGSIFVEAIVEHVRDKEARRQGDQAHTDLLVSSSPGLLVGCEMVVLTIRDTGPGIPAEHLPNVFERFYRADQARARATGGAGLGLAIVRQLVVAHGGRAWAESPPGQGAAFSFTLPAGAD